MSLLFVVPLSWGEDSFLFLEQKRAIHEQVFYPHGKSDGPCVFRDFYQGYSFHPERKLLRYNLNPEGGYAFDTELDVDACEVILGQKISSKGFQSYARRKLVAFDPQHRIRHVKSYVPLHLFDGKDKPAMRDSIEVVEVAADGQVTLRHNDREFTLTLGESTQFKQRLSQPIQAQLLELEPEETREDASTLYGGAVSVSYVIQDTFTNLGWCPKTTLMNARLPLLVGDTLYYVSERGNQYGLYQFDIRTQVAKLLKTTTGPIHRVYASRRMLGGNSDFGSFALNTLSLEELDLKVLDQNAGCAGVQNNHILLTKQCNLYLYDIQSGRKRYLGGATGRIPKQIDQNYLVWEDAPVPKPGEMVIWDLVPEILHEVTVYDINTEQKRTVSLDDSNENEDDKVKRTRRFVAFHDSQFVWITYQKDDMGPLTVLHIRDVDTLVHTKHQIPGWPEIEWAQMDGQMLVWQGYNSEQKGTAIYLYDIQTQELKQLSDGQGNCYYPDIANGRVVWQSDKEGHYNIYLYDLWTGEIQTIPVE